MKILLVDDDPHIRALLKQILKSEHIVDTAENAYDGETLAYSANYDVAIIDLILPDMKGDDLCEQIRQRKPSLPIIITSGNSTIFDKDAAFEKGASDYLVKPFGAKEVRARLESLASKPRSQEAQKELMLRDLVFNVSKKMITYKGERVNLRKKEMQLLEYLIINKGRVLTRGEILESVWDMNANPFTNTVDVHIKRLRDKLEKPYQEKYFHTVHGIGYLVE